VWKRHWKLTCDPYLDVRNAYVATPQHDEAVARLVDTIVTGQRSAVLRAGAGLGKSMVLAQALLETRSPQRRAAVLTSPVDGTGLMRGLAEAFGARVPAAPGRSLAWKLLADAVRLCRWQRLQVVFAIDDCQDLLEHTDRLDLERLDHVDPHPDAKVTILRVFRTDGDADLPPPAGELAIRLAALTRTETEQYLTAKLAVAGRHEPTFTPRAVDRLHALSLGIPRGLDRLGSLALMAGAVRGLEIIPPDLVDGVALECSVALASVG
jgi:type II secretory pathway predicted ATPase ExeA